MNATASFSERGLLTQKDLLRRWGFQATRSIQRLRVKYHLPVADTFGQNPLFRVEDVERVERERARDHERRAEKARRRAMRIRGQDGLFSMKEIKRRASGRKGGKR